jgi:hypothetical protein
MERHQGLYLWRLVGPNYPQMGEQTRCLTMILAPCFARSQCVVDTAFAGGATTLKIANILWKVEFVGRGVS